jgi:YfiH family protein
MSWITSKRLSEISGLVHGFLDKSFNGDVSEVARLSGLSRIVTLKQVHSSDVLVIKDVSKARSEQEGDAIATDLRGIGVGVFTADCVPLLLMDRSTSSIAVVHAGWRGTLSQIVKVTLFEMKKDFGTQPSGVCAVIGPSIGRCCYEVGEDVASLFVDKFEDSNGYLLKKGDSKYVLDLKEASRTALVKEGVTNIDVINICTKCNRGFHSYRREGRGVRTQLSFVGLV